MESSSRSQQIASAVTQPIEFALPELTFLIEILKKIKDNDLTSERSFIEIFSLYTTFNKYNVETEYDEEYDEDIRVLYTMENQPETKQKIEKVNGTHDFS